MSDFEDKLNKLLNDPEEMERFAGFAKSLMSGSEVEQPGPVSDIDPSMLKKISGMLSGKSGAGRDAKLLEAMRPFLSEKRRGKMDRARNTMQHVYSASAMHGSHTVSRHSLQHSLSTTEAFPPEA